MARFFIQQARLLFPGHALHGQTLDLLIGEGRILALAPQIQDPPADAERIAGAGLCVAPGLMAFGVQVGDPGFEQREDLHSAAAAALAGGFSDMLVLPNSQPAVHNKVQANYLLQKAQHLPLGIHVMGALTMDAKGQDMAEIYDMWHSGVLAFGDGLHPLHNSAVLLRCLQYLKGFGGLLFNAPFDAKLLPDGQMHEGHTSTSLGLRGIPALAETLMLQRDLQLLAYTESRLHSFQVSAAESVALLRAAKAKGLALSASVSAMHLLYTDVDVQDFDSNLKILPPLRAAEDQAALLEGLRDGTIDAISVPHVPLDEEAKKLEFPYAEAGAALLETAFPALAERLPMDLLVEKMAIGPRRVLGLPLPSLDPGAEASLTLWQEDAPWTFDAAQARSRAYNFPHAGQRFRTKVRGVFHRGRWSAGR